MQLLYSILILNISTNNKHNIVLKCKIVLKWIVLFLSFRNFIIVSLSNNYKTLFQVRLYFS